MNLKRFVDFFFLLIIYKILSQQHASDLSLDFFLKFFDNLKYFELESN